MLKKMMIIISVIFIVILCGTLLFVKTIEYNKKIQESYDILCNADIFMSGPVGVAASKSTEIKAYAVLFKSKNAKRLFMNLDKNATIEGKLFALCAMYYLDNDYYNKRVIEYETSNILVTYQAGCIIGDQKLCTFIKNDENITVRLINNKDTIDKWCNRNKTSSFITDFYGGGIPCELKDYIE